MRSTSSPLEFRRRRPGTTLLLTVVPLAVATAAVELTHKGIDILLLVVVATGVFLFGRLVIDRVAENFGDVFTSVALMGILCYAAWLATEGSNPTVNEFLVSAELRGYSGLYIQAPSEAVAAALPSVSVQAASARTAPLAVPAVRSDPVPTFGSPNPHSAGSGIILTETTVSLSRTSLVLGEHLTVTATVKSANGPVSDGAVQFVVSGHVVARVTVSWQGRASVVLTPNRAGSVELGATYLGSADYRASSAQPATLQVSGASH